MTEASPIARVPEPSAASIRRQESEIYLSSAGMRHRRSWLPSNPSRVLILVHGYAEHCGRYDEMAMYFARQGYAVHAYDQSGHGRSPGPRGDVDRFDRMLDELAAFVDFASSEHPGLPITLIGHSMGGLIAAATAAFRTPEIEHLVLSGALLELGEQTPSWKKVAARMLAPLGSRIGLASGIDSTGLSRDPEVARLYDADPYVKDRMSARFASGMMQLIDRMPEAGSRIEMPVLLLHGEADPISPPSGSRAFHGNLSSAVASKSGLNVYPDLRHEIFQEPERTQVWQDILDWIEGRDRP